MTWLSGVIFSIGTSLVDEMIRATVSKVEAIPVVPLFQAPTHHAADFAKNRACNRSRGTPSCAVSFWLLTGTAAPRLDRSQNPGLPDWISVLGQRGAPKPNQWIA